jgi:phosphohistidine phosphatase
MKIFLLRHADALDVAASDEERPLSPQGIKDMEKAAPAIAALTAPLELALASPLSRARETAQIALDAMANPPEIETVDFLSPSTPTELVIDRLNRYRGHDSIMMVGHEPLLSALGSLLLGSKQTVIEIKKGTLGCIEIGGLPIKSPGFLRWLVTSKQLRAMK